MNDRMLERIQATGIDRRRLLMAGTMLPLAFSSACVTAQETLRGDELPLQTTGLEHLGMLVPDVTRAAEFYGRLFNPAVHKEADPPLRYYVVLDKGYIALGSRDTAPDPTIDHYCVLLRKYDREAMDARLASEGLEPALRARHAGTQSHIDAQRLVMRENHRAGLWTV